MGIDYESVRRIEVADVYKAGRLAGQLKRADNAVTFTYLPEYLADGVPVATGLPLSTTVRETSGGAVPPFFAGLLPEGRRLASLRQAVKTSADDELSLLLAVGADPVGDVQVVAEGAPPARREPLVTVDKSFAEVRFAEVLAGAGIVDPAALPGVQDKGSAKGLSLPVGVAGDRYILKIDPPEHLHIVANEAYFLDVARAAGIPTTEWDVVTDAEGRSGLLVRRFDRIGHEDGTTDSLACEDACQLLDRWPADKYNVSAEAVAQAVARACTAPIVAARDVFRLVCFSWLTGNGDFHAKNVSVLTGPDGERRVAPAYDLPSTVPYGDLTLALSVGGRTSGISRRRLVAFGERIGIRERASISVIDELLAATADVVDQLQGGHLPFSDQVNRCLARELRNRRRLLEG